MQEAGDANEDPGAALTSVTWQTAQGRALIYLISQVVSGGERHGDSSEVSGRRSWGHISQPRAHNGPYQVQTHFTKQDCTAGTSCR